MKKNKKPKQQAPRRPLSDFRNVALGKSKLAEMIAESERRDEQKPRGKEGVNE